MQSAVRTLRSAVCLMVLNDKNQFLAISRRNDNTRWGLPGGKVDAGETNLQALVRECQEEVGSLFDAQALEPVYSGLCPGKSADDTFWVTTYLWKGRAPALEDFQAEAGMSLAWMDASQLQSQASPFADYNQAAFAALGLYLGKSLSEPAPTVAVEPATPATTEDLPPVLGPWSAEGETLSEETFINLCAAGVLSPVDGVGFWATKEGVSSQGAFSPKPAWATHVQWWPS